MDKNTSTYGEKTFATNSSSTWAPSGPTGSLSGDVGCCTHHQPQSAAPIAVTKGATVTTFTVHMLARALALMLHAVGLDTSRYSLQGLWGVGGRQRPIGRAWISWVLRGMACGSVRLSGLTVQHLATKEVARALSHMSFLSRYLLVIIYYISNSYWIY